MNLLKVRTEFSFKGVYAHLDKVVERLKELKVDRAAIVDVESTWGHVKWQKACRNSGIKPMFGIEIPVTDNDIKTNMWFLAKNQKGLAELYECVSKAHLTPLVDRQGSHPRMFREVVRNMSNNVIKFAGQITDEEFLGEVGAILDIDQNFNVLKMLKENMKDSKIIKPYFVDATANYYVNECDKIQFELLTKNYSPTGTPFISIDNFCYAESTNALVDSIEDFDIPIAGNIYYKGNVEKECRKGIKKRGIEWNDEYEKRLMRELSLIKLKKYDSYFLIVSDMTKKAKETMLVGPSRGSSAGSLVCYLMEITEIDPIPPGLLFERFIDEFREDLPDIDIDFPDNKRDRVFEYMDKKHGNTSRIGNVNKIKTRSLLNMIFKDIPEIPYSLKEKTRNSLIDYSGGDSRIGSGIKDTFDTTEYGKELVAKFPKAYDYHHLEEHATHTGIHAAGLILYPDNKYKYSVVDKDNIAHLDKYDCASLNLLKIDVLGLKTLSILEDAKTGVDWYNLKLDDEETYKLFQEGKVDGVFQFDGQAMKSVNKAIKATDIHHIDAVTALARPGPFGGGITIMYIERMNGAAWEGVHPRVDDMMKTSFGLPIYQEQTLVIVKEFANFDSKMASEIRNSISKTKGNEYFAKFFPPFQEGGRKNGYSDEVILKLWNQIAAMGAWQMNKSHTYSYAVLAYWTAYCKVHFPAKFTCSVLNHTGLDDYALRILSKFIEDGGKYVPFDPMKSEKNWSTDGETIYGGYMSIHGIGEKKAEKYIEMRENGELTKDICDKLLSMKSSFIDVAPFRMKYSRYYDDPKGNNIAGELVEIRDIPENDGKRLKRLKFMGRVIFKIESSENGALRTKKRGGTFYEGQDKYVDMRIDDGEQLYCRISTKDFLRIGEKFTKEISIGDVVMIEAEFYNGIKFGFVKKWRKVEHS